MINPKNEKGFILFYMLLIVGLISLIAMTCFFVTTSDLKVAFNAADSTRAYYIADAGLADAFMQLRASGVPPTSFTVTNNSYPEAPGRTGSYSAQVTQGAVNTDLLPVYTIVSKGTYGQAVRTLSLAVKTTSFSRYGYLSGTELDPVWGTNWFITGMITTGPAHTNGQFNMYGTPVFTGVVSQVNPNVNYWSGPPADNPDYEQGLITNAPALTLPVASQYMTAISTAAQQPTGLYLTGDTSIVFLNNGTMNVTNVANGWTNYNTPVPPNSALFVHNGTATVQGVLKGKLTVGSDKDIYIGGNLIYNTDPRKDPTSTDMLGMVAQNNAIVTSQGPFDIEVDGYIVALQGQFLVENFWTFAKGNMVQYGGLTSNLPGGLTGLFDPTTGQVVFGYNQLQYFDTRLETQTPPWFPPLPDSNGRIFYNRITFAEG